MNDTAFNDYILIKANPYIISDYDDSDDRKFSYYCDSPEESCNQNTLHDSIESNDSCRHSVTTSELLNFQRPRNLDKIDIVPAAVYGPLPFS